MRRTTVLLLTAACAVAGGLLGSHQWQLGFWRLTAVLVVGSALGVAVAIGLLTTDPVRQVPVPPRPAVPPGSGPPGAERPGGERPGSERPGSGPSGAGPGVAPPPAGPPRNASVPAPRQESARQGSARGGREWWTESPPADPGGGEPAAAPPPRHEVTRAVVAQCPHCGGFQLDVRQDGDTYEFDCRDPRCRYRWSWRAGDAWPTTVVRRNLNG
ncbi:hypothetical protein [Saccharothrix sp. Mg75]|uniref:hypothetical protein n=1 Tax=Saccharothrix sp. Mg75 TaxID=3445357 RepID=UPI003EEE44AD